MGSARQLRDEMEAARRLEARQAVAGEAEKLLGEHVRRRKPGPQQDDRRMLRCMSQDLARSVNSLQRIKSTENRG